MRDTRVRLYAYSDAGGAGDILPTYTFVEERWGRVEAPSGRAAAVAGQQENTIDAVIALPRGAQASRNGLAKAGTQYYKVTALLDRRLANETQLLAVFADDATFTIVDSTAPAVATVTVSPSAPTLAIGATQQMAATVKDADGNVLTGRVVTWLSGNPAVATVSDAGLVTAIANGGADIVALVEGVSGSAVVTVGAEVLIPTTVTVSPASFSINIGQTQQLAATVLDQHGAAMTGQTIAWASSDQSIATVDANGLVIGISDGTVAITASCLSATPATADGAVAVIATQLLLDEFTTDQAAPLPSTRTCQPGPGTLAVVDTSGTKASIASGKLILGAGSVVNNPAITDSASRTLAPGLGLYVRTWISNTSLGSILSGWARQWAPSSLSVIAGCFYQFNEIKPLLGASTQISTGLFYHPIVNDATLAVSPTPVEMMYITTSTGGFIFLRGAAMQRWRLVWVVLGFVPGTAIRALAESMSQLAIDRVEISSVGGEFASDNAPATFTHATSTAGQTETASADAIVFHTITAATGATQELWVRREDANNGWIVRMSQSGGTIKIIEKTAGVETERASAAQTWTNGTAYAIAVICDAYSLRVMVNSVFVLRYDLADTHATAGGVFVSTAGSSFIAWRRYWALPAIAPPFNKTILPYGDSKTNGQGDDTNVLPLGYNGYAAYLCTLLSAGTGQSWYESPKRLARASYTVNMMRGLLGSDLAANAFDPDYVLINLGANDMVALPTEAQWTGDLGYIVDAMHRRWPLARVLLMRPWRRSFETAADTLAAWITETIATRPWCALGPDEQVFLKGDDNGASLTVEGVHPNHAGHLATAAAWQAAMGF